LAPGPRQQGRQQLFWLTLQQRELGATPVGEPGKFLTLLPKGGGKTERRGANGLSHPQQALLGLGMLAWPASLLAGLGLAAGFYKYQR